MAMGETEVNRRKQFFKTMENMLVSKRSVITIPQEVNPFCSPVALLVAKYRLTKSNFRACNSVIFRFDANGWNPPTGDYLGELTSELQPGLIFLN